MFGYEFEQVQSFIIVPYVVLAMIVVAFLTWLGPFVLNSVADGVSNFFDPNKNRFVDWVVFTYEDDRFRRAHVGRHRYVKPGEEMLA